jgi:hypothetical protein
MKSRRFVKKSQKKSKKNNRKKSVKKKQQQQQQQQYYHDAGIIKDEIGLQVLPSTDNPKKHIFIDFGMDKVSDDDVSLNYWINYGKCQECVTRKLGVKAGINIEDGISSFNMALDIVRMIKGKDRDIDVYVVYASSSSLAGKTEDLLSEFTGLTISDFCNNDDITKCSKAVEESQILMTFVLFVKRGCPISTHIGIFKNSQLFSEKNRKKNVKNLSLYLHSYSCYVTSTLYPEVEYIITRPVPAMSYILYSNLKDKGEGSVFYGSQYERNIINQRHEYIAKVERISMIHETIETILAKCNWDEVITVVKEFPSSTFQEEIFKKIQYIKENLTNITENEIMEYIVSIENYLNSLILNKSYSVIGKEEKSVPRFLPEDTTIPSVFDDSDRTLPSLYSSSTSAKAIWKITRKNGEIVSFERPLWFYYHKHLDNTIPVFIGNVIVMSTLFEW